jgi:hypothetical protein
MVGVIEPKRVVRVMSEVRSSLTLLAGNEAEAGADDVQTCRGNEGELYIPSSLYPAHSILDTSVSPFPTP